MQTTIHPVDEKLPAAKLFTLGIQHVLVMYAGAIAVPLIIGGALHLPKDQIAFLINADLFCCGLVTLIQALGIGKFGIRMPVMMGVTFAAVGPMVAMAGNPSLGILSIYGAVIASGIFGLVITPFMSRAVRFFPPVVTGTIITVIGITLMRVGINWAAGGQPMIFDAVSKSMQANPNYGAPLHLAIAFFVLASIMVMARYLRGFLGNISVLLGMVLGFLVSLALGKVSFDGLGEAGWFAFITPFQYGMPTFDLGAIVGMCLVMIVTMVESTGMFLALSELTNKRISNEELANGLRADALGTVIGGVFNTFPYTSFSQNIGLVGVTGVRSRYVCAAAGLILLAFGMFPKMAHVAASIPVYVLGGAGIVMFGMVAATGIKILGNAGLNHNRHNLFVVAVSIGAGMIPLVAPQFFSHLPHWLSTVVDSGILLATITAVTLNLFFNGPGAESDAKTYAMAAAHSSDH